ncbi:ferritin-like domain-domain-containing protein [Protomyces lactucae-debilis]|uniref:Ferritin-like domain-domain-containing protein n=1 Tax=Protomyces lactucae-debilis TaxID=2754530 RepID=A0A1Y2FF14_PROLT|nr:ferritin-like domain-containing protein [Protomyces lactucae-debilis]ORY82523.1 ferritin-like domain-domain-containing protein [Protomyces lactucae-debilis]
MRFSLATLFSLAAATAVDKRQSAINDGVVLNYALTLEHLENAFYRGGLAKFTQADFLAAGFSLNFYDNLKKIASDEATHVNFLTAALKSAGIAATGECMYNFGYKSVKDFVSLASVLEGVGVSAYIGAASFIDNSAYLTAAAAIVTVEARHSSFIRSNLGLRPFATPFDTPLDFNEVYSLASAFITSCPATNPALPVKAFPTLMVTAGVPASGLDVTNDYITFKANITLQPNTAYYLHFINGLTVTPVKAFVGANGILSANIPANVFGQVYVVATASTDVPNDSNILAGPAILEVLDCKC